MPLTRDVRQALAGYLATYLSGEGEASQRSLWWGWRAQELGQEVSDLSELLNSSARKQASLS